MLKKLISLLSVVLCGPMLAMSSTEPYLDVVTEYIHGFTGNPSGALEMVAAFPSADTFEAAALPDTQIETGYGLNRLIAYCATFWKKNVNRSHAYMGQTEDIAAIDRHVRQIIGHKPMILFGNCRGGTAALNYVAMHNPENLKAMVLEAIPGDLPATLHPILSKAGLPTHWDQTFFRFLFPSYPKNPLHFTDAIAKISDKKLPILLFHSRQDATIPFVQALELYSTLKKNGFENVHLVVLPGKHVYLLKDCEQEYLTAIHSFYKQYGLVHDAWYATQDMKSYHYPVDQAEDEIAAYKKSLQEQCKQAGVVVRSVSSIGMATIAAYQKLKDRVMKNYVRGKDE